MHWPYSQVTLRRRPWIYCGIITISCKICVLYESSVPVCLFPLPKNWLSPSQDHWKSNTSSIFRVKDHSPSCTMTPWKSVQVQFLSTQGLCIFHLLHFIVFWEHKLLKDLNKINLECFSGRSRKDDIIL